jgi:hypothetical protein
MQGYVRELLDAVEHGTPALLALSDAASARHPAPGKWSPREIVGHLVDSATHNLHRFIRAQFQDDLVFTGYAQDAWVATQRYQEAPWAELVALWGALNRHLARVMVAVPEAVRRREHRRHNLHEMAWRPVPAEDATSLDYFMGDYVGHLQHHLRQILGPTWTG